MIDVLHRIKAGIKEGSLRTTQEVAETFLEATKDMEDRDWALTSDDGVAHLKDDLVFKPGELIKFDSWFKYDGLWFDAAISQVYKKEHNPNIVATGEAALKAGIKAAKAGNMLSDISKAIHAQIKKDDTVQVIRELGGHFIGSEIHMKPSIRNFHDPQPSYADVTLETGMRMALEPLLTEAGDSFNKDTWRTTKGGLSSHVEATIEVTPEGGKVLYIGQF